MNFCKHMRHQTVLFSLALFIGLSFIFPLNQSNAQRREHLTPEEIEIVRDVQAIDYRMIVFIKAIERRFMVLNGIDKLSKSQLKRVEKDLEVWGELPKESNTQLFYDIDKILDESISKIEDVADHDEKNKLLPIALHIIADRAKLIIPRLKVFAEKATSQREIALLNSASSHCKDIIDASKKIKRPGEKEIEKRLKKLKLGEKSK